LGKTLGNSGRREVRSPSKTTPAEEELLVQEPAEEHEDPPAPKRHRDSEGRKIGSVKSMVA
jgi:hypothetical protein